MMYENKDSSSATGPDKMVVTSQVTLKTGEVVTVVGVRAIRAIERVNYSYYVRVFGVFENDPSFTNLVFFESNSY